MLIDRKFRLPRHWSNDQLRRFAPYFSGSILNASGWKDEDKEGSEYRYYFRNATEYQISNFMPEARGLQGLPNEFFLDLTKTLDPALISRFDCVFNHTTLEHIFDVNTAFKNLCLMSKDIVILVLPFLQQMHGDYGDYWRFTPTAVERLFQLNGVTPLYTTFNNHPNSSIYIFTIGSKDPDIWGKQIPRLTGTHCDNNFLDYGENKIGCRAVTNTLTFRIWNILRYALPWQK
jgi:hypothetical protein